MKGAPLPIRLIAVAGQLALAFPYVGLAVLTVPGPMFYLFWIAWAAGLVLVTVLAARRSWFALVVPAVWLVAYFGVTFAGQRLFGWSA